MVVNMMENFIIIIFMDKELSFGQMADNIMENGKIIKWMDKDILHGKMVDGN